MKIEKFNYLCLAIFSYFHSPHGQGNHSLLGWLLFFKINLVNTAPDKAKLLEFSKLLECIEYPEVKSDEAKKVVNDAKILIAKVSTFIKDKSKNI